VRIAIVGAGAIGGVLAAHFARSGHEVELVGRPAVVEILRTHGLRLEGTLSGVVRVHARTRLDRDASRAAVLLTVKTFDLATAARGIAEASPTPIPILLTENGLGIEPGVLTALREGGWAAPEPWVVRAVHSLPATAVAPGVVRAAGTGELLLPELPGSDPRAPRGELFLQLLRSGGLSVRTVSDFEREVWRKALVNAAINPVTALNGVVNGDLARGPLREQAVVLLEEARHAAGLAGFPFTHEEALRDFDRVVAATAANRSSMLQDIERGRPTEIDAISGELTRVGAAHDVDLPATRAALRDVRARAAANARAPQPS
jgi:2-dehydropantoate 2-reductase